MSGKVPQIVVKRPVFTRNVDENEIDFVIHDNWYDISRHNNKP